MKSFQYFMPTKIFFGKNCILENKEVFQQFGKKAMIFTGKNSAKKNGSLDDVVQALREIGKEYIIFDEVEENPTIETVGRAAEIGREAGVDFNIGIGGGSPMDTAKAVGFLIPDKNLNTGDLFLLKPLLSIPLIEIPTTAGTGSETTPYAVVTLHSKKMKSSIKQHVFANVAFLDSKYIDKLPDSITANTAIDALTHLIEGYTCVRANFLSDKIAEAGFSAFSECIEGILSKNYTSEVREKLLITSSIAGFVISQTGTSIPHFFGYGMTYYKNVPHGRANALIMRQYLKLFENKDKINKFISILGFKSIDELCDFFDQVLDSPEKYTEDDLQCYTSMVMENKAKLAVYDGELSREDIYDIYKYSLLNK